MRLPDKPRTGTSGPTNRRAGRLVFLGLNRCDLVGRTGFEPVTSSVSGNFVGRACFHILAMTCYEWSVCVHWRLPPSAAMVTQLLAYARTSCAEG